ncbi:hypothetical protein [Paraburkholderia hospita]|uniref:hypothetical protein n=1 Tax=Paraburkholderia hospita TaxID=169430 RepID=UPI000DEF2F6D|nr:hypothetical protein [Paraburkholderia hospita]AXF04775.1 hypothetical protein CUJ88_41125 [Paraburkholderia hospita]
MSGVFLSVPVALHVAYMMPAYPNSPESLLAKVQRMKVRKGDVWRYSLPKVVFFESLNALEIRAQCALIREKVARCLQHPECTVIRARYGLLEYEDLKGVRRFAFSADLADAFDGLSRWLAPSFGRLDADVRRLLVAYAFTDSRRTKITLRRIAAEHGHSHVYYHHYYHAIDEQLTAVEVRALDLLTPLLADRGTCNGEPVVELITS